MKSFITSSFLIVVIVPLCSGLRCLTCGDPAQDPAQDPNHFQFNCNVSQVPVIRDCPKGCFSSVNDQLVQRNLGCADNLDAHCYSFSSNINYRECSCGSDLCNDPEQSLKCLACEGEPVGYIFETDYVCKKGETPTEKRCLVGHNFCFNRWTATKATVGCMTSSWEGKTPYYSNYGWTKEGICNKTDNCNTHYEEPTKETEDPIIYSIGEMKSPLFSLVFAVATSSIYYHQ